MKQLDPGEVPEVARLLAATEAIEAFKEEHGPLYDELKELYNEYNASRQAAEKILRAQEASSGPFRVMRVDVKVTDAERLFNEVGETDFKRFGGTVLQVPQKVIPAHAEYAVDAKVLKPYVLAGQIPKEITDLTIKRTPFYEKPEDLILL